MRPYQDLRAVAEHLAYEVDMLRWTGRTLTSGRDLAPAGRNALVESFTLHARALVHFFDPARPKDDDALAEHFYNTAEQWTTVRGPMPDTLGDVRRRVGKEIAHLSYQRVGIPDEAKAWRVVKVLEDLDQLVQRFAETVPSGALPPRVREKLLGRGYVSDSNHCAGDRGDPDVTSGGLLP